MEHFENQNRNVQGASAGEDRRTVKRLWLELLKTSVFLIAAAAVIVIECIAWFSSNSRVQSEGVSVSAQNQVIRIASKGERQTAEESFFKPTLSNGIEYRYREESYYYTEDGTIALRLAEDNVAVFPGAKGTVEFYIIPTQDGPMSATLHVGLAGYAEKTQGSTTYAEPIVDSTLDALLSGHILLFRNKDENGHYSGWLGMGNTINVTLPEESKKDVPFAVTFHWIWPLRYENMVSDLYADDTQADTEGFSDFVEYEAAHMTQITENYRFSRIFLTKENDLSSFDSRSNAYNQADEYIGTKADYLYLTIQTTAF